MIFHYSFLYTVSTDSDIRTTHLQDTRIDSKHAFLKRGLIREGGREGVGWGELNNPKSWVNFGNNPYPDIVKTYP